MHTELSQKLRQLATNRASSLDRLIYTDATNNQIPTGDILILEDTSHALTLLTLADTLDAENNSKILVRLRSIKDAQQLYALIHQHAPSTLHRLHIAGLHPHGTVDPTTFSPRDFLSTHRFNGSLAYGRLPKSHAALADWAENFAKHQNLNSTPTRLVLGGNTKHMTPTFNQTLSQYFQQVRGLRGKGKHRSLEATQPHPKTQPHPSTRGNLHAYGGVFSGSTPDRGGQLLAAAGLTTIQTSNTPLTLLDLGCGNGSVSVEILKNTTPTQVTQLIATDIDMDAVRSATANLSKDPRATTTWDDAATTVPDASIDLVLLNPPFHDGTRIDLTLVQPLLDAAQRILKPGGTLLLVHNSHARYRPQIEARFTQIQQITRNKTFTILSAHTSH